MRDGPRVVRLTTESGESTERDAAAEKVAIHLAAQGVLVAYGPCRIIVPQVSLGLLHKYLPDIRSSNLEDQST